MKKIQPILYLLILFAMVGTMSCVNGYFDDYGRWHPTPPPNPDPYYPPNPDPYYPPNPDPYYPPNPHHGDNGRIVVTDRDIGGGNFFTPKIKISVTVYGKNVRSVSLYAISNQGDEWQLDSASCSHGASAYLNGKYNNSTTRYFEVRLYNHRGYIVARETIYK